jgi:hypothetical protein
MTPYLQVFMSNLHVEVEIEIDLPKEISEMRPITIPGTIRHVVIQDDTLA